MHLPKNFSRLILLNLKEKLINLLIRDNFFIKKDLDKIRMICPDIGVNTGKTGESHAESNIKHHCTTK